MDGLGAFGSSHPAVAVWNNGLVPNGDEEMDHSDEHGENMGKRGMAWSQKENPVPLQTGW